MGKFNNDNNIIRSKQDIINDYVDYLVKIDVILEADAFAYKSERGDEVIELLLEKCYEMEMYKGQMISTLNAFYHYVNFILSYDISSRRKIWNPLLELIFYNYERNKNTCLLIFRGGGKTISEDTLIETTEGRIPIKKLSTQDKVYAYNEQSRTFKIRNISHVIPKYKKKLYEVTLESGKTIEAAMTHPFYNGEEWIKLSDLNIGDYITTPLKLPFGNDNIPEFDAILLGSLISEGNYTHGNVTFTNKDREWLDLLEVGWNKYYGTSSRKLVKSECEFITFHKARTKFLANYAMNYENSYQKFIPNQLFYCNKKTQVTFLKYLFEGDGCYEEKKITYTSVSKRLVDDIQRMLMNFGIYSKIRKRYTKCNGKKFLSYELHIGTYFIDMFMKNIGFFSKRKNQLYKKKQRNPNLDYIKLPIIKKYSNIFNISNSKNYTRYRFNEIKKHLSKMYDIIKNNKLHKGIPNKKLNEYKIFFDSGDYHKLLKYECGTIMFERIISIKYVGEKNCYDLTIGGEATHNYIANNIMVHNSYMNFVLYSSFKMFLFKHTDFLLITNIPSQAIDNLRILKNTIDGNELLFEKKDTFKGKDLKWTERQIEYNGGLIHTRSLGTTPKGLHVNYVICDDIITDTTVYSYSEIENYVLGQAYPCVQRKRGRFIVSGTPLSSNDVYHVLMNEKINNEGKQINDGRLSALQFYSIMYPALVKGVAAFPDILNENELAQIRITQGDLKFEREYLLKATDTSASLFKKKSVLKCIDKNYQPEEVPTGNNSLSKTYALGADIATSGAASADESAFVTIEILETRNGMKKIIRKVQFEKGMPITSDYDNSGEMLSGAEIGQVETLQKISRAFNNARTIVEKNNVGVALIQELQKRNVYVEEFVTTAERKKDMVRYLISEINHGNIIFPEPNAEIQKLIDQILNFGIKINKQGKERMEALSGHDDGFMALAIVNYNIQQSQSCAFAITQD